MSRRCPSISLTLHQTQEHNTRDKEDEQWSLSVYWVYVFFHLPLKAHAKKRSQLFNRLIQMILTLQAQWKWWLRFSVISLILKNIFTVNRKLYNQANNILQIFLVSMRQHQWTCQTYFQPVKFVNILVNDEVSTFSCLLCSQNDNINVD